MTTIGTNVPTGACGGAPAVLTEARGEFGSSYGKGESCQWRIQVDDDQVNVLTSVCLVHSRHTQYKASINTVAQWLERRREPGFESCAAMSNLA